jgi:hypothetical protein
LMPILNFPAQIMLMPIIVLAVTFGPMATLKEVAEPHDVWNVIFDYHQ